MTKCPFTVGQKSLHGDMFVLHHRAPMDTTTVGHDFAVIRGASESPCHKGFLATFRVAKTHWWIVTGILTICLSILKYIEYPQISNFRSCFYWACLRCWVFQAGCIGMHAHCAAMPAPTREFVIGSSLARLCSTLWRCAFHLVLHYMFLPLLFSNFINSYIYHIILT